MTAGNVETNIQNPISYGCASFDGTDDKITFDQTKIDFITYTGGNYSISFFFRWKAVNTSFFHYRTAASNSLDIGWRGDNQLIAMGAYNGTTFKGIKTATIYNLNQWYHFCGTVTNSTTYKIYINGVEDSGSSGNFGNSSADNMGISNYPSAAAYPNGYMRDFKIFDVVLTQAEITKLANNDNSVTRGLRAWYKLNGDARDSIGTNHGTVTGAVFVNQNDTIDTVFTAARSGATDKYLAEEINGQILTAVINET